MSKGLKFLFFFSLFTYLILRLDWNMPFFIFEKTFQSDKEQFSIEINFLPFILSIIFTYLPYQSIHEKLKKRNHSESESKKGEDNI